MAQELFVGLMSGTSLDGIDAVLVDWAGDRQQVLGTHHLPMPDPVRTALLSLSQPGPVDLDTLMHCDRRLGLLYADAVGGLLAATGTAAGAVRAIGCHGQTLRHCPTASAQCPLPWTLQIGDPATLAVTTGIPVVSDFRRADIAAGGQGAPLVPAFHAAVFHNPQQNRVIVNIGGIANLSVLPTAGPVTGFDTGPGNSLMDLWTNRQQQQPFDRNGQWARSGKINRTLVEKWLQDPWFALPPPKSTGRETFGAAWLAQAVAADSDLAAADIQASLCELTALSIARAIKRHAPPGSAVFACGGGARNGWLMQRLGAHLPQNPLADTAALDLAPEWVEGCAFAWLARQRLHQQPGNLPAVTGANRALVLGALYQPEPR